MKTNRINEMMATMKSFSKDKYQKDELLTEMFALQQEIVRLTFNDEHAATADLKIWDVERHLEQLNIDCRNVADKELQRFKEESKTLCNLIKKEISGNRGEAKAFKSLQNLKTQNIILENVELSDGKRRTELDAIVITPMGIVIVEVKNTTKNIFIDEIGDYYRTGQFLKWDCNIAKKLMLKKELLEKALVFDGIEDIPVKSIVVFTNNRIEVQNNYPEIQTCFLSQLAHLIDDYKSDKSLEDEMMIRIEASIRSAECKESYPFEFDAEQYKRDFATLMVILEEASAKTEDKEYEGEVTSKMKKGIMSVLRTICSSKQAGYIASVVADAAVTAIYSAAVGEVKKGGAVK